jgi:hypothetical protein
VNAYEPGTVAVATVRGVPDVRVMRCGPEQPFWMSPAYEGDADGSEKRWRMHKDRDVTDVRPLVVLDLDDIGMSVSDLVLDLRGIGSVAGEIVADQIEAQTKPQRIPEPGLWGVVEAHTKDNAERRQFGRVPETDEQHWIETDAMGWFEWRHLVDPVLVRDGIEETS